MQHDPRFMSEGQLYLMGGVAGKQAVKTKKLFFTGNCCFWNIVLASFKIIWYNKILK
jgi:hypothetical protein